MSVKINHLAKRIRKALGKTLDVRQSNIAGRGLFTRTPIEPGERLFPMFSLNRGESYNWRRAQGFPLRWPEDVTWGDLTWKVNHQKSCNCILERDGDTWYCVAQTHIPADTEITINYEDMPEFSDRNVSGFIELE